MLDQNHGDDGIANEAISQIVFFPFSLPRLFMGDTWQPFDFAAYPYANQSEVVHRLYPEASSDKRPLQFRLMTSFQRESSTLKANRLQLRIRSMYRVDLELGITRYQEKLAGGAIDEMRQWKAMALYSFGISPRTRFSVGAGLRDFRFAGGERSTGFAFRYGLELFPKKPLRLWAKGEIGRNSDRVSGEYDIGAGVLVNRFELFAAYRSVRFVGLNFDGPTAGIAAWF